MLAIKLQRIGKKHQPSYRVVVAEKRSKLDSPPVEDLGSYNPDSKNLHVKKDRAHYWIQAGAQPTVTVHNLLVKSGIVEGKPVAIKMPKAVAKPPVAEKAPEEASAAGAAEAAAPEAEAEVAAEPAAEAAEPVVEANADEAAG